MIIPERFAKRIDAHLLGNMLQIAGYPLILTITGRPGVGKTWQLRNHLEKRLGFEVFSFSSADLESEKAGTPAKLLRDQYVRAAANISKGTPSAIVIDDIDTTAGEWEKNTGTVNHQQILSFFMHIADTPTYIESIGNTNRVPIIFTGNNFDRIYEPLRRSGRMTKFEWEPTREEKIDIISSVFSFAKPEVSVALVDAHPTEPISFFSNLLTDRIVMQITELAGNIEFKRLLTDSSYKKQLSDQLVECIQKID